MEMHACILSRNINVYMYVVADKDWQCRVNTVLAGNCGWYNFLMVWLKTLKTTPDSSKPTVVDI